MSQFLPKFGPTIQNLTQRCELFRLIRDSHVRWRNETKDPKLKELHGAVVDHFQAIVEQYEVLLDELRSPARFAEKQK